MGVVFVGSEDNLEGAVVVVNAIVEDEDKIGMDQTAQEDRRVVAVDNI